MEFEILKSRQRVSIVMTRHSVCAGNECDAPHEKKIEACSVFAAAAFALPKHQIRNRQA